MHILFGIVWLEYWHMAHEMLKKNAKSVQTGMRRERQQQQQQNRPFVLQWQRQINRKVE